MTVRRLLAAIALGLALPATAQAGRIFARLPASR